MKITKWVDFGQEVEIDVGMEDIRGALAEAFSAVTQDRLGEPGPNRNDLLIALNSIGAFLNALTDEHIGMMTPGQKKAVSQFLAAASSRFE